MLPHQQAAAIIGQLGGAAGILLKELSVNDVANGGPHATAGELLEPVSYILAGLQIRHGPLAAEEHMMHMQKYMRFK